MNREQLVEDAAKPKALKWGCRAVPSTRESTWFNVVTACGKYALCGGVSIAAGWREIKDERGADWWGGIYTTESAALAALDACQTPPPGYVEPTPAPTDCKSDRTELAGRIAAMEQGRRAEFDTLSARVAELERFAKDADAVLAKHGRDIRELRTPIDALRRDVRALSEQAQTDRENSASMFLDHLKRIERLENPPDKECPPPAPGEAREATLNTSDASPAPIEQVGADARNVDARRADKGGNAEKPETKDSDIYVHPWGDGYIVCKRVENDRHPRPLAYSASMDTFTRVSWTIMPNDIALAVAAALEARP